MKALNIHIQKLCNAIHSEKERIIKKYNMQNVRLYDSEIKTVLKDDYSNNLVKTDKENKLVFGLARQIVKTYKDRKTKKFTRKTINYSIKINIVLHTKIKKIEGYTKKQTVIYRLAQTLLHELVHVKLFQEGNTTHTHGVDFEKAMKNLVSNEAAIVYKKLYSAYKMYKLNTSFIV